MEIIVLIALAVISIFGNPISEILEILPGFLYTIASIASVIGVGYLLCYATGKKYGIFRFFGYGILFLLLSSWLNILGGAIAFVIIALLRD